MELFHGDSAKVKAAEADVCAQMGFDELLLDDFHYPREGRMSRIKTDERTMTQQEALALLADDIHTALEQAGYKGKLSVSVDADIALAGSEEKSGIVMSELTEKFDRVYVKVTADQLESVSCGSTVNARLSPLSVR